MCFPPVVSGTNEPRTFHEKSIYVDTILIIVLPSMLDMIRLSSLFYVVSEKSNTLENINYPNLR